jgi:hypothetical protein
MDNNSQLHFEQVNKKAWDNINNFGNAVQSSYLDWDDTTVDDLEEGGKWKQALDKLKDSEPKYEVRFVLINPTTNEYHKLVDDNFKADYPK